MSRKNLLEDVKPGILGGSERLEPPIKTVGENVAETSVDADSAESQDAFDFSRKELKAIMNRVVFPEVSSPSRRKTRFLDAKIAQKHFDRQETKKSFLAVISRLKQFEREHTGDDEGDHNMRRTQFQKYALS